MGVGMMMNVIWTLLATAALSILYTAFMNGAFKRCPHCGKIGSWRYDKVGEPQEVKDEDDILISSVQELRCRKCGMLVTEIWADQGGRRFEKKDNSPNQEVEATGVPPSPHL